MSDIVVIGPGRMGTALALCFEQGGHRILGGVSRPHRNESPESARFMDLVGAPVVEMDKSRHLLEQANVILITVPDKAVTSIAQTLFDEGLLRAGQTVVHTAGALSSEVLVPVTEAGAYKLCMHPLQAVANPQTGSRLFKGTTFTLEGDREAVERAIEWVHSFGGVPVCLDAEARPRYHAAAVLASNAIVALAHVASQLANLPTGVAALLPLIKGAIANIESLGLEQALTGPIERGDISTVMKHLEALRHNPTTMSVYLALGRATADLAFKKGSLTDQQRAAFEQLFASWEIQ